MSEEMNGEMLASAESNTRRRMFQRCARFALTILIVGLILWQIGGVGELGKVMSRVAPLYVVMIIGAITMDRALMTFKWTMLLSCKQIHLPFFEAMRMYCASMIWGMFMPMTVGADAVRAYSTSKAGISTGPVIASIMIERMIGFLAALLVGLLGFLVLSASRNLDAQFSSVAGLCVAMLLGTTIVFLVSFSQTAFKWLRDTILVPFRESRILAQLAKFHEYYRSYRDNKGTLAVFLGLSILEQLTTVFYAWLVAVGMNLDVSLIYIAGAVPLAMLVARIPISIHGLGVFDGVFAVIMLQVGVPLADSIAVTLGVRILEIVAWMPWWLAHVIRVGTVRPPTSSTSSSQSTAGNTGDSLMQINTREESDGPSVRCADPAHDLRFSD